MAKIKQINGSPRAERADRKRGPSPLLKYYLVAYNLLNALGWGYILLCGIVHVFALDSKYPALQQIPFLPYRLIRAQTFLRYRARLPDWALVLEKHIPNACKEMFLRTSMTYERVGWQTTVVQAAAAMEIVHSALGWVRSPLPTVALQVVGRIYSAWAIPAFPDTRYNPLYTTMILSWSITEVIRYAYYALNLLGHEPYSLLYLRYTTFYVLYLTGAFSEGFLLLSTLPDLAETPLLEWSPYDWFRLTAFCIWWPALYVLYTYMIKQRSRVLGFKGPGNTLGAKPKAL